MGRAQKTPTDPTGAFFEALAARGRVPLLDNAKGTARFDIVDPTYSGIMFQTNYGTNGQPQNPIKDSVFTNVTISGAQKSGDAFDAKSGFGIWANPMPESGQGPAVGTATFTNLQFSNNYRDIENTTSTFTIVRN